MADWRGVKDYEVFGLSYHRRIEVASAEDWNRAGLGGVWWEIRKLEVSLYS